MIDGQFIRKNRWFLIIVVLPTVIAAIYYFLFAADRYVSESRFVVKNVTQRSSQISTLANLIQTTGMSAGQEQTSEIIDYIRSRGALSDLTQHTDIRAKFASSQADRLSRYPAPFVEDRFENLYRYYGDMVHVKLDPNSGLAVLTVEGFSSPDAHAINENLLELSEALVNRLNEKARTNAIAENEKQVALAEQRVKRARSALAAYRNKSDLLDPTKQAAGVLEVANKLVSEQAALQAQLDVMRRIAPANPGIPALASRVAALSAAIQAQNDRVVGSGSAISSKISTYDGLALEQEFASQVLTVANTQLAQARAEAAQQQYYLERVVEPDSPDLAAQPERFIRVLTVAGILLCLYLVGWMLIVGILEHAPEG